MATMDETLMRWIREHVPPQPGDQQRLDELVAELLHMAAQCDAWVHIVNAVIETYRASGQPDKGLALLTDWHHLSSLAHKLARAAQDFRDGAIGAATDVRWQPFDPGREDHYHV